MLNNDAYDEAQVREMFAGVRRLQVVRVPASRNLGSCVNTGGVRATGAYIAKIDDDDFYGPFYIGDLLLSALESGADIVGKKATFFRFQDAKDYWFRGSNLRNRWLWPLTDETGRSMCPDMLPRSGSTVLGATLFAKREILREFAFDENSPSGTDTLFQVACRRAGKTIYAADEFNFCCMRHDNGEGHLWQKTRERFLENAVPLPSFDCSLVGV